MLAAAAASVRECALASGNIQASSIWLGLGLGWI